MSVQVRKSLSTKWVQDVRKQQETLEGAMSSPFLAERMKLKVTWKGMSSQTYKYNVKILGEGKYFKLSQCFNCSRASWQPLILSKWEVLGSVGVCG